MTKCNEPFGSSGTHVYTFEECPWFKSLDYRGPLISESTSSLIHATG